jgi:hypothetical protein
MERQSCIIPLALLPGVVPGCFDSPTGLQGDSRVTKVEIASSLVYGA